MSNNNNTGEHYMTTLQDARKLAEYAAETPDGPYSARWAAKATAKLADGRARAAANAARRAAAGKPAGPTGAATVAWIIKTTEEALAAYAA